MNADMILYVVIRHDDVNHVRRGYRASALCGMWIGNEYIVQRPLCRGDTEPPTCVACAARTS